MSTLGHKIGTLFSDRTLRVRILFVLGALAVFRLLGSIPVPGVDAALLADALAQNQFLGLLNIFSGGGFTNLSIIMIGVAPYITASIIMQLLTIMVPRLKEMYHEEGDAGRKKFIQYSRLLVVPLGVIQAVGFLALLSRQGIITHLTGLDLVTNIIVIVGGSILLMWIGELITEFGIGNGVSLIIFGGIIAGLPGTVQQWLIGYDVSQLPMMIGFVLFAVLVTAGVVAVTEAERPIPITYAKRVRGSKIFGGTSTYLPLRVNQSGVMPIIFALSFLLFPPMIFAFLGGVPNDTVQMVITYLNDLWANPWFYGIFYFILVFFFTYFYTAVTFDPESISKSLQRGGAFIPGVRPGVSTSDYIGRVVTRITLVGALFLGIIAVLPIGLQAYTGNAAFAIGGTALLIVVSVVLDLVKKVDAQVSMREY